MLALAGLRYRDVLADQGGPIEEVAGGPLLVAGRSCYQASARLRAGLAPRRTCHLYSDADGCGSDPSPVVARYKAISEALERWAYRATWNGADAWRYGFDVDPTSNGMAAFPGITHRPARRKALLEAVERWSILNWWEGNLPARPIDTDWPGIEALAIEGPAGGVTCITYRRTESGRYAFGHAAAESLTAACDGAMIEMGRHERVVRKWHEDAASRSEPTELLERRALFFASEEGFGVFSSRLAKAEARTTATIDSVADCEIPGPWSRYAMVWRVAFRPPSDRFWNGDLDYFFL